MWRFGAVLFGLLMLAGGAATAQTEATEAVAWSDQADETRPVIRLMDNVPKATVRRIRRAPQAFLRDSAELIVGHGSGEGIGPDGLEQFIALNRAELRARAMHRLMEADLNNDGSVTGAEMSALIASASARWRGRLSLAHISADTDANGRVSWDELRAYGERVALEELSEEDAIDIRGFMAMDLNDNGLVSLGEVRRVLQLLSEAA